MSRRGLLSSTLALPILVHSRRPGLAQQSFGRFNGRVVAEWLADGRNMRLTEPFEYIDQNNRRWPVPEDTVVDGASIPQIFWSITGGPFEGLYRAPSVVHDHYCERRTRKSFDVHEAFYNAMLCAGVGPKTAVLMHRAVAIFGPSWDDPRVDPACQVAGKNDDLERCTRNLVRPPAIRPAMDKQKLSAFVESMRSESDPRDLEKLNAAISSTQF